MAESTLEKIVESARGLAKTLSPRRFERYLRGKAHAKVHRLSELVEPLEEWTRYDGPFPPSEGDTESLDEVGDWWRRYLPDVAAPTMEYAFLLHRLAPGILDPNLRPFVTDVSDALSDLIGDETLEWIEQTWPGSRAGLSQSERSQFGDVMPAWDTDFVNRFHAFKSAIEDLEAAIMAPQLKPTASDDGPIDDDSTRDADGRTLIGWAEILECLNLVNTRSNQSRIKRYRKKYTGPVVWVGRIPHVDRGELRAWWNRILESAEDPQQAQDPGRHVNDPYERERLGFHEERRPNAKGKIRSPRS